MKKIIALILAMLMLTTMLAGCGQAKDDAQYIEDNGEMIVGITYFAPMNYKDDSGKLIGFETEFAEAVCEKLGVDAKFQVIDWNSKETELKAKNIDCIWNGMTITPERAENMEISQPYMRNRQVMVVKAENLEKYTASAKGASVVAEKKSAGEELAQSDEFFKEAEYTAVKDMKTAIIEVSSGTADIAVVDYVTSIGSIGEGTDFDNLVAVEAIEFAPEEYGIAFRKGSEIVPKVNEAINELIADGTLETIAKKYKLENLLIK